MTWAVIIRKGLHFNYTLASILYDKWGSKTNQDIIICDDWDQGYTQAKSKGHQRALFVDSGTIFVDWNRWKELMSKYPHRGLIAHIIWKPGQHPYLDQQCWFMDLNKLNLKTGVKVKYPFPIRSEKNVHDDYTPLCIMPGREIVEHSVDNFGQNLIAQQMSYGLPIVNWNNSAREIKTFSYQREGFANEIFSEYINLAETQLWVLNNENISQAGIEKLLCPGSGLFWVLNIVNDATKKVTVIDVSRTQIEFCKELWSRWDGEDYGSFAWEFIKKNNLKHFELDIANLSPMERLKLRKAESFIPYVNLKFQNLISGIDNFSRRWTDAKTHKNFSATVGNLVEWVVQNNGLRDHDLLWASNILDYKWTMIDTPWEICEKFKELIK